MACVAVHDGHLYSCMVCCCGFVTDSVGGDGWTHMVKLCAVDGVAVVVVGVVVGGGGVVVGVFVMWLLKEEVIIFCHLLQKSTCAALQKRVKSTINTGIQRLTSTDTWLQSCKKGVYSSG